MCVCVCVFEKKYLKKDFKIKFENKYRRKKSLERNFVFVKFNIKITLQRTNNHPTSTSDKISFYLFFP